MLARKCDACETYYDHYDGRGQNEENPNGFIFIDRDLSLLVMRNLFAVKE